MLWSLLRLGTHGRFPSNLLICASPIKSTRHSSRRPVRILNETEQESPLKLIPEKRHSRKKKVSEDVYRQSNIDGEYYIKSEIPQEFKESERNDKPQRPAWNENENDFQFSKYMVIVKSRNKRRKEMITLLEGKRLVSDAILAGVKIKALFVSLRSEFQNLPLPAYDFKLHWMPYKYFQKWSDVKNSSGVMAIAKIPSVNEIAPDPQSLPLTVICDNIQDPGNMGAIIRVLAAVGSSKILVTKGCVDIWEPKVLRAGAGGHFRVPIDYDLSWEDINSRFEDATPSVYVADSGNPNKTAEVLDTSSVSHQGDEGNMVNDEKNACPEKDGQLMENAATSDNAILEFIPYYTMKFDTKGENVLVISNEYFGPSQEALAFASARKGVKIHIPLCGKVESLNVVSAMSIIAFEMKRQALLR